MTGYSEKVLYNAVDIAGLSLQYVRKYVLWNVFVFCSIILSNSPRNFLLLYSQNWPYKIKLTC